MIQKISDKIKSMANRQLLTDNDLQKFLQFLSNDSTVKQVLNFL